MYAPRKKTHAGFTLIEILVALALITLLAVGISLTFDGTRSRAQTLVTTMSDLAAANMRLKNDTGCYANVPALLFDAANYAGDDDANFCLRSLEVTWNGPYATAFVVDANGLVVLDRVADGVTLDFERGGNIGGGSRPTGQKYFVAAKGVPDDIVRAALFECNGSEADVSDFTAGKCRGSAALGTFDMLFDETR